MESYGVDIVVGNMLYDYKHKVVLTIAETQERVTLALSEEEKKEGVDLEEQLIAYISACHSRTCKL